VCKSRNLTVTYTKDNVFTVLYAVQLSRDSIGCSVLVLLQLELRLPNYILCAL